MAINWLWLDVPDHSMSSIATNGYALGMDQEDRAQLCILYSKNQCRELMCSEKAAAEAPEDVRRFRKAIAGSWLPKTSDRPYRLLEGLSAFRFCDVVLSLADVSNNELSSLVEILDYMHGGVMLSPPKARRPEAIVFTGGPTTRPTVEVCYSKRQCYATFDVFRALPGMSRQVRDRDQAIKGTDLPEESDQPSFRIDAFAGSRLFARLMIAEQGLRIGTYVARTPSIYLQK